MVWLKISGLMATNMAGKCLDVKNNQCQHSSPRHPNMKVICLEGYLDMNF